MSLFDSKPAIGAKKRKNRTVINNEEILSMSHACKENEEEVVEFLKRTYRNEQDYQTIILLLTGYRPIFIADQLKTTQNRVSYLMRNCFPRLEEFLNKPKES